jgi:carbonic anhydrase/acetyltransferase-like protein (isoleucine patch superfamily)
VSETSLFALDAMAPQIAPDAFVAPGAVVIGDVTIGAESSVWFHCVLRGDTAPIRVGRRSNIQDGSILHVTGSALPTVIGDEVTIGHAAVVHACTLHNRAFVAIGATVLDGAVIEEAGVLAAGALLTPGKRIGRNEIWHGSPARLVRVMSEEERARFDTVVPHYVAMAARYRAGLRAVGG